MMRADVRVDPHERGRPSELSDPRGHLATLLASGSLDETALVAAATSAARIRAASGFPGRGAGAGRATPPLRNQVQGSRVLYSFTAAATRGWPTFPGRITADELASPCEATTGPGATLTTPALGTDAVRCMDSRRGISTAMDTRTSPLPGAMRRMWCTSAANESRRPKSTCLC